MDILEHLSHVQAALREDTASAVSLMAESVFGYFDENALREAIRDPKLAALFVLSEDSSSGALDSHASEAEAESKRAWAMHKSLKHHVDKKVKAHDDAESAHMYVAMKHDLAKNAKKAQYHYACAEKHAKAREDLGVKPDYAEALLPAQTAAKDAQISAHMAQWRASQLKKKLAAKKGALVAWLESINEGGYSDEVKNASMNAAKATAKAKTSGSAADHGTAAVAHRIARDLAKSGGHHELAAKHDDFHIKHVAGSKAVKVA